MKKLIPVIVAVVIVVGGAAFYGGMRYERGKNGHLDFSSEQRRQAFQQTSPRAGGFTRDGGRMDTNVISGEIITQDDKSITIKINNGGSQIVFLSQDTEITKSVSGSSDDLTPGETVFVSGKQNRDGSITAQTVQLRPQLP
ncbi:MAG: DUF5666 domain-containing protein [Candidatus Uhrbacteria bacterium]